MELKGVSCFMLREELIDMYAIGNEPAEELSIEFNLICISNIRKLIDCMTLSLNYYNKLIVLYCYCT